MKSAATKAGNNSMANIIRFLSCITILFIAYIPAFKWMIDRWSAADSYYGHGFLIPLVSAYIIWHRRHVLGKAAVSSSAAGLLFVAIGVFVHVICASLRIYFMSGFSFVFVLYGIMLFFFGKEITGKLRFPLLFLLAMVPLPLVLVGALTVELKLGVAQVSAVLLNGIGFPSILDGSIIRMPDSFIIVGEPCSGLRSLISLFTLGLLFAYAAKISVFKKVIIFLASVPIALATNVVRVMLLAIVNDIYGEKIIAGFFHDFTGYLMFGIAFIGLLGINRILEPKRKAAKEAR